MGSGSSVHFSGDSSKSSHPMFGDRSHGIHETEFIEGLNQLAGVDQGHRGFNAYVHLPFCRTRCVGCTRVAAVPREAGDVHRYLDALSRQIATVSHTLGTSWGIDHLHIGGGTPNSLDDADLSRVFQMIEQSFVDTHDAKASMDVDPLLTTRSQLDHLVSLGVGEIRIELRELTAQSGLGLGRSCPPGLLATAIDQAREAGISTITIEMVYGIPGQTEEALSRALYTILGLRPDRVICSPFEGGAVAQMPSVATMSIAQSSALFITMIEALEKHQYTGVDLHTYIQSNDALMAEAAQGTLFRNRLGYSSMSSPWVLGFGAGALSELPGMLVENETDPTRWQEQLLAGDLQTRSGVTLSSDEISERMAIANLGAQRSVRSADFKTSMGLALLAKLRRSGLVVETNGQLQGTQELCSALPNPLRWSEHWWRLAPLPMGRS